MPMEILATGASGPAGGAWSVFSQVQVRRRHTKIEDATRTGRYSSAAKISID
jgi:hypothetical protein